MHYVYLSNNTYDLSAQGDKDMEPKSNKNESLEALDFIINVLKEHEKDLDSFINQLGIITEKLGETGEIASKIENIEDRITTLQDEISNLVNKISVQKNVSTASFATTNTVNINCRKWEDFKNLASEAKTVSYLLRVSENIFQADALKHGKVISYKGELPSNNNLLKLWLAKELNLAEADVFEGDLNFR